MSQWDTSKILVLGCLTTLHEGAELNPRLVMIRHHAIFTFSSSSYNGYRLEIAGTKNLRALEPWSCEWVWPLKTFPEARHVIMVNLEAMLQCHPRSSRRSKILLIWGTPSQEEFNHFIVGPIWTYPENFITIYSQYLELSCAHNSTNRNGCIMLQLCRGQWSMIVPWRAVDSEAADRRLSVLQVCTVDENIFHPRQTFSP